MKVSPYSRIKYWLFLIIVLFSFGCIQESNNGQFDQLIKFENILDYSGTPTSTYDRSMLAFSDKGAWFAYSFPDSADFFGGFSGPFIMTQENGVWCSQNLSQLNLMDKKGVKLLDWKEAKIDQKAYVSHLQQVFKTSELEVQQTLFFTSSITAAIKTSIKNLTNDEIQIFPQWSGLFINQKLSFISKEKSIEINSSESEAKGIIKFLNSNEFDIHSTDTSYVAVLVSHELKPNETIELVLTHTFYFPGKNDISEEDNIFTAFINYRI